MRSILIIKLGSPFKDWTTENATTTAEVQKLVDLSFCSQSHEHKENPKRTQPSVLYEQTNKKILHILYFLEKHIL